MSRSTKPVFNNIQVNGTLTYLKGRLKILNSLVNLTNAGNVIFLLSWNDWDSSRKFLAQRNGLVFYCLFTVDSRSSYSIGLKGQLYPILEGGESGWEVKIP